MSEEKGLKIQCKICGNDFIFSKGEQEFFAEKGLKNIPKACPKCRETRKKGEDVLVEIKCQSCGKKGMFRKKIEAKEILCAECYTKQKEKN